MKHFVKYTCGVLVFFSVLIPSALHAAGLAALVDKTRYEVGESFLVQVRLQTDGTPVNAVSGTVVIPEGLFEVSDLRYGGSIVSLWTERPAYDADKNTIAFSGGIPGGFNGITAPLFSFAVKAISTGKGVFAFKDSIVLKNDGSGSPYVSRGDVWASVVVLAPTAGSEVAATTFPSDETPPEPFVPVVWLGSETAQGEYSISFNAYDAETGIDHYEVKEVPRFLPFGETEWVRAENLYTPKNQMWITDITVRAFDRAGNIRESIVVKPFNFTLRIVFGCIAVSAIIIFMKIMRKKNRPARRKRVQ